MKARILALLILAALPAAAQEAPGPLTLDQAIEAVLARYPSLDAAQAAIEGSRGRIIQARAPELPQVSAQGNYGYFSYRPHIDFSLPGIPPAAFYTTVQNSYNAGVNVRQLLSDFGRTQSLVALARTGEISAQDALEQVRHQLGYEMIQAFYGTILLRASDQVAAEEISSLEEALRISQGKFRGGTATRFDVLTTEVRLANSRNRRTDTEASLAKQEALVRQLLGRPPAGALDLQGDFKPPATAPDFSDTVAQGLEHRPEMKLARDSARSAQLSLEAASRESRPSLSAEATGGVQNNELPNLYQDRGYATAGVSLSVPLFTGRRIAGERVSARADLRGAEARVSELDRTITTEIEDAFTDLKAALARLASADALVAQAQEALALAKSRYSNGVITNFELLDAQSNARAAELTRLQARYDCVLARQAIARAAGDPPVANR